MKRSRSAFAARPVRVILLPSMSTVTPAFQRSLLVGFLCLGCGGSDEPNEPAPLAGAPERRTPSEGSSIEPQSPPDAQAPAAVETPAGAPRPGDGADDEGDAGDGEDQTDGTTDVPPEEPATPEPPGAPPPFTAFLAGDSIVQTYPDTPSATDQAGWGQMLGELFDAGDVTIENHAIGGRTARRFIDEGRLDAIVNELEPGDFLLVQFGTNDGNRTATYQLGDETIPYFLDPATDFKSYLQQYIDGARERGAIPVLVTPPPRNSAYCTGGNGTGGHAQAMRELGRAQGVPVVDLNALSVAHLMAICPAPTPEDFFLLRADGTVDGTHFQENGARVLASLVAGGLREAAPALAPRLD